MINNLVSDVPTDIRALALFRSKVPVLGPEECWPWQGYRDARGYGSFHADGKRYSAHRVAYALSFGEIPASAGHHGTVVRHSCDNPRCCNPAHLSIGTQQENIADMYRRGRAKPPSLPGILNGAGAKLTEEQVIAIRADDRSQSQIAKDYGVSQMTISRIKRGKKWRHVAGL